mmetsp:Transcript_2283/g.2845  ORF Transcript_2283/g.2845 Transcript_2283/m.2845 type:complete len:254 (-) Transcript_2283:741-1502(-)
MLILSFIFLGVSIISDIFMASIEVITSQTRIVYIRDELGYKKPKKVAVWNPTVANLTLMALGSSAPEILLSLIETIEKIDSKPGELGPSTIVGSAAFNLLMISAVSIYSVSERSDTKPDRDQTVPLGVKKINDLGVFAITVISSIFAYIWLYICVMGPIITLTEAWLTLSFFFIMLILAYTADKLKARSEKKKNVDNKTEGEDPAVSAYAPIEFYTHLLPEEIGNKKYEKGSDLQKAQEMRDFLKNEFNTDKI